MARQYTNWKDEVYNIHETQNGVANFCLVVSVTSKDQGASYDVVGEHLPVILPPLFNVHHHNLL